jgi:hypothetical protein
MERRAKNMDMKIGSCAMMGSMFCKKKNQRQINLLFAILATFLMGGGGGGYMYYPGKVFLYKGLFSPKANTSKLTGVL